MDNNTVEFVRKCDRLLQAASTQREAWVKGGQKHLVEAVSYLITGVERLKARALDGTLLPAKGAGLGMTRAVGEWGDDTELYDLAFDLEQFYRTNM